MIGREFLESVAQRSVAALAYAKLDGRASGRRLPSR